MFERLTDRSRLALVRAQDEARLRDSGFIGTEHLLLGLLHDGEGPTAEALSSLGINPAAARSKLVETVDATGRKLSACVVPTVSNPAAAPRFSTAAKAALDSSSSEALRLRDPFIREGHLLLGLLGAGDCIAVQVLTSFSPNVSRIRKAVLSQQEGSTG